MISTYLAWRMYALAKETVMFLSVLAVPSSTPTVSWTVLRVSRNNFMFSRVLVHNNLQVALSENSPEDLIYAQSYSFHYLSRGCLPSVLFWGHKYGCSSQNDLKVRQRLVNMSYLNISCFTYKQEILLGFLFRLEIGVQSESYSFELCLRRLCLFRSLCHLQTFPSFIITKQKQMR